MAINAGTIFAIVAIVIGILVAVGGAVLVGLGIAAAGAAHLV